MKKSIFIFFAICLTAIISNAQDLHLGFSAGLAFANMEGARSSLENKLHSLPYQAGITDNFPAWFEYKAEMSADFDMVMFGVYYMRSSTGGRISAKDYSANYFYNVEMINNAFGFSTKLLFDEINKTRFFVTLGIGQQHLKSIINEEMYLYSTKRKTILKKDETEGQSIHALAGLFVEKRLTTNISVAAYVNYYFSPFYTESGYRAANWKGFRSGLTFCIIVPESIKNYSIAE